MSAASRKNDPFHFDEIYKQAGVGDLFVKKTMAEQKQKPPPAPVPSASPTRPAMATPAPRPVPNPSNFDLGFLTTITTPAGTPPSLSKHSSAASLAGAGVAQQQQPSKPGPAPQPPLRTALDDPFALFEELPGAAPAQKHAPPPPPAAALMGGAGGLLLDFGDGHAFPSGPAAPAAPAQSSKSLISPAASPRAPEPPSQPAAPGPAPVPAAAAAPPPQPPPPDYSDHAEHRPAPPGPTTTATRPLAGAGAGAAGAAPASPPRPPPTFPDGRAPTGPSSWEFSGGAAGSTAASASSVTADYPPQHPHPRPHQHPHPHHQQGYSTMAEGPESSQPSNSSSPSFTWGHAPSGSGISGYLKAFGKKAVRVAKAGLAQLEHALEGLDQPGQQPGQQQRYQPQSGGAHTPSSAGPGWGRSGTDGADVSNDEALAWAVRLADLPPHAQQQELGNMAPPLRRKVIEVLREQIRSEHEAAAEAAGVAPSGGLGHGAQDSARAAAPPPPPYGHGTPLPPGRPSSQDGMPQGQQPPGAPRERAVGAAAAAAAAPPPPAYNDATQHPAAPAQPAVASAAPAADLLGIGSGEPSPRTAAAGATPSAATAAAAAAPAPVVDDLLGFGDGPSSAPALHSAAKPSVAAIGPGPAATAAAVAAAPPPPLQPVAVHVDDMDDFFSGGKSTHGGNAAAAGGGGLAMHGSSSAPNLGAARPGGGVGGGVTGGRSSTAALADMLHGSDDEGGVGADVDVSGYADLYRGEQGTADEPELRKRLRAQREAAKHAKMKAALAEKLAMEAEEAARREQQVVLKDQYKADIESWKNKNKGNIRGLLGSLHTVLWPDSGWAPVSVGDLLEPGQVKRVYMKANLLVHPDKVRQRNGSAEQVAIADMVFDVLKEAWNIFR